MMNDSINNEPQTLITSHDLAEEMAYAELPHQNMRLTAEANNLPDEASRQMLLANEAGVIAGKAFLGQSTKQLEAGAKSKSQEATPAPSTSEVKQPDIYALLSPEKQYFTDCARVAMAHKFEHLGAKPEDFELVSHEAADDRGNKTNVITLIYAAAKGLDLGDSTRAYDQKRSWNGIFDKKNAEQFMIEVDGQSQKVDTRSGTTLGALKQVAKSDPSINEWAWRTGEANLADRGYAPIVYLVGGGASGSLCGRDGGGLNFGFRPAVVIQ